MFQDAQPAIDKFIKARKQMTTAAKPEKPAAEAQLEALPVGPAEQGGPVSCDRVSGFLRGMTTLLREASEVQSVGSSAAEFHQKRQVLDITPCSLCV